MEINYTFKQSIVSIQVVGSTKTKLVIKLIFNNAQK